MILGLILRKYSFVKDHGAILYPLRDPAISPAF
ncbi:hypothetical protein ESA_04172 [Cronobacter sakazakii ATCC BAA-894]|uniref:Uncharacterized protein n=1 Tax=Cronobacter sakazakii (strain ATCC BAA-894) TaxID=290339 RepID=A7MKQ9_CROS8|nr:hypothetical protein ESA_04172 [Cronobacter sakazakii ATCC BAA-894]